MQDECRYCGNEHDVDAPCVTHASEYNKRPATRRLSSEQVDAYVRACNRATTDQGLDGVVACLRMAGLPVDVDQTGGFTMCVRVQRPNQAGYIYVTWNGNDMNDTSRSFIVGEYSKHEDVYEALHYVEDQTIPEVVSLAAAFINGHCIGCGMVHDEDHECEPLSVWTTPKTDDTTLVVGETYTEDFLRQLASDTGAIIIGLDDDED